MSHHVSRRVLLSACVVASSACVNLHHRPTTVIRRGPIPLERSVGRHDAPIRIDVFSDFQCRGCAAFQLATLASLRADYCAAGKVYLVHHEYPLPIPSHAYAREAARWALAAAAVGKYEPVADALFRGQAQWGSSGNVEASVASVLSQSELSQVKATLAASAEAIDSAMAQDLALGQSFPVRGTPAFRILLHGTEVFADHDEPDRVTPGTPQLKLYANLKSYIEGQLAK